MSNTNANFKMTGILLGQEVCKRKTPQEKITIIQQTMELGINVSHVARLHGIQPSLIFKVISGRQSHRRNGRRGSHLKVRLNGRQPVFPAHGAKEIRDIVCLLIP